MIAVYLRRPRRARGVRRSASPPAQCDRRGRAAPTCGRPRAGRPVAGAPSARLPPAGHGCGHAPAIAGPPAPDGGTRVQVGCTAAHSGWGPQARWSYPRVCVRPAPPTITATHRASSAFASHGRFTRRYCKCSRVVSGDNSETRPIGYCTLVCRLRWRGNTARSCATNRSNDQLHRHPLRG